MELIVMLMWLTFNQSNKVEVEDHLTFPVEYHTEVDLVAYTQHEVGEYMKIISVEDSRYYGPVLVYECWNDIYWVIYPSYTQECVYMHPFETYEEARNFKWDHE